MSSQTFGKRIVAYVGSYPDSAGKGGGISAFEVGEDGSGIEFLHRNDEPAAAGYLVYSDSLKTLYSVDERKTDGRGPVGPAASVHAFAVDPQSGRLTHRNALRAPGPYPTYLSINERERVLACANHGSFDHIEQVVERADGSWGVEYHYDSSTVIVFDLEEDGGLRKIRDLKVLTGHGLDPNNSPQAGGHGQASAHAHCATFDPNGSFLVVCDKATDRILVYRLGERLDLVTALQMPPETGPRHVAFDVSGGRMFATLEFASEVASFAFDGTSGALTLLDRIPSFASCYAGPNEPAELRVHPNGKFLYANNRGEDSLAWFAIGDDGKLQRLGSVAVARSLHPGVAARSFAFAPDGTFIIFADRPANLLRSYRVDDATGALMPLSEAEVLQPAFVEFVELPVVK